MMDEYEHRTRYEGRQVDPNVLNWPPPASVLKNIEETTNWFLSKENVSLALA